MHKLLTVAFLTTACISCTYKSNQDQPAIAYPQPSPDSTAFRFLEGIVTTDSLDFNSAFSPDGKSFYFSRSVDRQWDILVSTHDGAKWTEPVVAGFCDSKHSEADPAFSPDGKLYYISNRHDDSSRHDHDIWVTQLLDNGNWLTPENLAVVNSDSNEYYISFAGNGNMYFGSARKGGFGGHDIYISRYASGSYTLPENLGPSINTAESEHDPAVSKEEEFMVFKSENRPDGFGSADLYCSLNSNDGWKPGINLGTRINTNTYEYCSYWSPDGKYFFYSSEMDVKWIGGEFLKREIYRLHGR
jgi:Tol biopolymer transport system component